MRYINLLFTACAITCFSLGYAKDNNYRPAAIESRHGQKVEQLSDSNFSDKISKGFTIVDFYADWCAPCRRLGPTFNNVANDLQGSLAFYKANIDTCPASRSANNVKSIPTIILFRNGHEVSRLSGEVDEAALKQFITSGMGR